MLLATAIACGGSSLPEPEPCAEPSATPDAQSDFAKLVLYYRAVETGELELESLLGEFRGMYPEGRFYRSSSFRDDWVKYAGASTCIVDELAALEVPVNATSDQTARDTELKAVLAEYRRVLERGTEAVRQRNTSDYRDFNRNINTVATRLQEWVDQGFN
jgi:hypothetical protein